jgi:hypothetical protein
MGLSGYTWGILSMETRNSTVKTAINSPIAKCPGLAQSFDIL